MRRLRTRRMGVSLLALAATAAVAASGPVSGSPGHPDQQGECPVGDHQVVCVDLARGLLWVQEGWDGQVVFGPAPVHTAYEEPGGWHRVSRLRPASGHFLTTRDGGGAGDAGGGDGGGESCVALRHEDGRHLWPVLDDGDWVYVFGQPPESGSRSDETSDETCA
ncbi:hypothetical protein [Streptomyces sp. 6N223]|uniref:hypothetical protein n=1 Tax=Streptomyces sp. 6N223 TaxID=3457412 RepID=UPI003FD6AF0E